MQIECPLCLQQIEQKTKVTLECHHTFNQQKINNAQNKILCPQENCNREISYNNIRSILYNNKQMLQKHERFLLKYFEPSANEKLMQCPIAKCQNKFLVWKQADYTVCNVCKFKFCTNCFKKYHQKLTCEEVNEEDETQFSMEFKKYLKNNLAKKCPKCKTPIIKQSGCNFMTCRTPQCSSKTFFCYLCGIILLQSQHYEHFGGSPFNNTCKNQKIMIQRKQSILNKIPCAGCGQINPNQCTVHTNSNKEQIYMDCKKCSATFCICGQKLGDQNFDKHINKKCNGKKGSKCLIF